MNLPAETATQPEKEDTGKSDQGTSGSPRGKVDGKSQRQNCNGSVDGRTMKSEEAV
uniref:Uncharacterized protein n=1 Tax=Rhizophora mucronata TaxID=61149 RepID=A0A2P2NIQ4_RHIMU